MISDFLDSILPFHIKELNLILMSLWQEQYDWFICIHCYSVRPLIVSCCDGSDHDPYSCDDPDCNLGATMDIVCSHITYFEHLHMDVVCHECDPGL